LHGITSNTALKPASLYNWNGVYRARLHLAPWRLFGFRHTQTMRVPSITQSHDFHVASSNICRKMALEHTAPSRYVLSLPLCELLITVDRAIWVGRGWRIGIHHLIKPQIRSE